MSSDETGSLDGKSREIVGKMERRNSQEQDPILVRYACHTAHSSNSALDDVADPFTRAGLAAAQRNNFAGETALTL